MVWVTTRGRPGRGLKQLWVRIRVRVRVSVWVRVRVRVSVWVRIRVSQR